MFRHWGTDEKGTVSGYTDDAILHGVLDDVAHFIAKPCTVTDLTRKIREVLDR